MPPNRTNGGSVADTNIPDRYDFSVAWYNLFKAEAIKLRL